MSRGVGRDVKVLEKDVPIEEVLAAAGDQTRGTRNTIRSHNPHDRCSFPSSEIGNIGMQIPGETETGSIKDLFDGFKAWLESRAI